MEIACKIEADPEGFFALTKETDEARDPAWGAVVEFSVDEVFIWSMCHIRVVSL